MKHNPLATYIYDNINSFEEAMKHKIAEWHVMVASRNINIETFDKRKISIEGVEYSGTLITIFWSFFDPFIKDYISRALEEIRIKSIDTHIDAEQSLKIFNGNMQNSIKMIYHQISETDRLMRGKGYPKRVTLRSANTEIEQMINYLNEKVDAQMKIANNQKWYNKKRFILEHMHWWIFVIIFFMYWLCKKMGWNELKDLFDKLLEKI